MPKAYKALKRRIKIKWSESPFEHTKRFHHQFNVKTLFVTGLLICALWTGMVIAFRG